MHLKELIEQLLKTDCLKLTAGTNCLKSLLEKAAPAVANPV